MTSKPCKAPALDTRTLIESRIYRDLRESAFTAAGILAYVPGIAGDEKVGDWLSRLGHGTVREDRVMAWLEAAAVNPWRPVSKLSLRQRFVLAEELRKFARGLSR